MQKLPITNYTFKNLRKSSGNYGGASFESVSTLVHSHLDFYEIILITQGQWEHTYQNTITTLPTGTLLLFKPGAEHQLLPASPQSVHFVICVEEHYFERMLSRHFPGISLDDYESYITKTISHEKAKYMESIGSHFQKTAKLSQSLADEFLLLTLFEIVRDDEIMETTQYVEEIIYKLDKQIYMNISVQEIYDKYPYSHSVLLNQFKKITGKTIVEYKADQKLKHACHLLEKTNATIAYIAASLHYDSLSYFVHSFKKKYGMTPTQYRKKHKKQNSTGFEPASPDSDF